MSYLVAVDVGGTFTDVVAVHDGLIVPAKVATNPASSDVSVLEGAAAVHVELAEAFNLASTAGLNAVITRRLPKIGFLTSEGARDFLDVGTLARPVAYLTDPTWRRAFSDVEAPLVPRYLRREVPGMLDHFGRVYRPLDEDAVRRQLAVFRRCEVEGVAVSLARSWINPAHERRVGELVREELGDIECCLSSEVSPLPRPYNRAVTTVVNTCMRLLYGAYTARLDEGLRRLGFVGAFNYADCRAMLAPAGHAMARPYRLVAGGPAGGTVASAHFGGMIGDGNLICADVGGTSCDISVVSQGKPWVNTSFELEFDLHVSALSVDIVTLGAGGGSIVSIAQSGDVRVGPDSAGADPGPACYGRGGNRPTTTDTALLIGILDPDGFLGGKMKLDPRLSAKAFEGLDTRMPLGQLVAYAWQIGLNNLAEGIFNVGLRHGIDTRDFTLVAYGAAGPMMLPSLLDLVPLRRVVVPPHPGLFSALGLLSSDQVFTEERGVACRLEDGDAATLEAVFAKMEADLAARLPARIGGVRFERSFDGRLQGQGFETPFVPAPSPIRVESRQPCGHVPRRLQARNANRFDHLPVEVMAVRVNPSSRSARWSTPRLDARLEGSATGRTIGAALPRRRVTPRSRVPARRALAGDVVAGPAVVREAMSTTFVPGGHRASVGGLGELVIT